MQDKLSSTRFLIIRIQRIIKNKILHIKINFFKQKTHENIVNELNNIGSFQINFLFYKILDHCYQKLFLNNHFKKHFQIYPKFL